MKIKTLDALKILNSRGEWTIAVKVLLEGGATAVATLPQGVSEGANEAVYLPPEAAVRSVKEVISPALAGLDPADQKKIDATLIALDGTPNKSGLGANAILGASIACARAAAFASATPLWRHLRNLSGVAVPDINPLRLYTLAIEGGRHSFGNLRFQEFLVIPKTHSFAEAARIAKTLRDGLLQYFEKTGGRGSISRSYEGGLGANLKDDLEPFAVIAAVAAEMNLLQEIDFGLDAAATNVRAAPPELFAIYREMMEKFKPIFMEDIFGEEDFDNFAKFFAEYGRQAKICGDDLVCTNLGRMKIAREKNSINSVIIKPNQIGTVMETLAAVKQARDWDWHVVVSHRGGDTNDDFIADLAWGVGADGIKLGGVDRGERVAKYNRFFEIESEND